MACRTIEVSGIPFIPDEELLVDFLEDVVGNGSVRACRLLQSSSHESSSSSSCETEGDGQVRALVETESAESSMALYNLAEARILVFWCAELAVKFVSCPHPDHLLPPDLSIHEVPSDPEMWVSEEKSSTEDLLLEPTVSVSKVDPDINVSEPIQLSEPRVSELEVVQEPPEPGPKFYVPEIFGMQFVCRPKIPETKVVCEPEILSKRNSSLPKDSSDAKVAQG